MTKILIALGLTLAASTGAFAQPDFNYDRLPGASYGTEYRSAGAADIDYTATASIADSSKAAATEANDERNYSY